MRSTLLHGLVATLLSIGVLASHARAQSVLYRCESATEISIQGTPCPKGVAQRKIALPQTEASVAPPMIAATGATIAAKPGAPAVSAGLPPARPAPTGPTAIIAPPPPRPGTHWVLVTDDAQIRGPNEPYPLWQCMRADGSTWDSRNGVAGKQWVPVTDTAAADGAPTPPSISSLPKGPITREIPQTVTVEGNEPVAPDLGPPPPGAAAGRWVADHCERLPPEKACARFAARRDLLRRQIYAAAPSDRATYAPEEQDLTIMLYTACGR